MPLSAHSRDALDDLARAYLDVVASDDSRAPVALVDLCHSASELRSHHDHRLGVVARSRDEAAAGLRSFLRREPRRSAVVGRRTYGRAPKLAFVFSGQGSQWQGMGRTLLAREPVFRATLTECDEFVTRRTGWSLLSELTADEAESRMHETAIAQPTLVAMQIALAALWRSWGIEPAAVVGHSVGEIAAAAVSGALTLPDALQVAIQRGRIMQRATGRGRMAAVALGLADSWDAVLGYRHVVSVAASNSPVASVLSGETAALERMLARLSERGVGHRWLPMSYAFHSMQMQPFEAELAGILAGLEPQVTAVPMYSTLTGDLCAGRDLDASYWGRQLRSPVLFAAAIDALLAAAHETFVELSPDPVLAAPIAQCLRAQERAGRVLPSLRRGEDDRTTLLETLGALYVTGYHVDWASLLPSGCRRIRLPNYPWQRERHWIDGPRPAAPTRPNIGGNRNGEDHPLLGREVTIAPAAGIRIWELELESRRLPYLSDHRIDGAILLPVAAYIEMALAAAAEVFAREPCSLADVVLERPLTVSDAAAHTVQIIVTQSGHRDADFHICSHPPRGESGGVSWTLHARGRVRRG